MTKKEQIKAAIQSANSVEINLVMAELSKQNVEMRVGYVKRIIRKYFKNAEAEEFSKVEMVKNPTLSSSKYYNPKFQPFLMETDSWGNDEVEFGYRVD